MQAAVLSVPSNFSSISLVVEEPYRRYRTCCAYCYLVRVIPYDYTAEKKIVSQLQQMLQENRSQHGELLL